MLGFGSAKFTQGTYGKGVQQGFVKATSTTDVSTACHAIWQGWPTYKIDASGTAFFFGGLIQGAFADFQGTTTIYASNILMTWDGNLDLGSGTSTMYASCKIAWDGQEVADTTWTTQTIE